MAEEGPVKVNSAPFLEYLNNSLAILLKVSKQDLTTCFAKPEIATKVEQFLSDQLVFVILVGREWNTSTEEEKKDGPVEFFVDLEVSFKGKNKQSIAFCKRPAFAQAYEAQTGGKSASADEGSTPLADGFEPQLQIISVGATDAESTPFELVHLYLQYTFTPLFHTYGGSGGDDAGDQESKIGLPIVQKKIAELTMSLMQCQQNVEIPEISLAVDKEIHEAFAKAKAEGKKLTPEDFTNRLGDAAFLNQLQNGVNGWIKEIQKVTKLQRDSQTGSAMQEINFWLGMEKALQHVQQQLQSPEVDITLNLLKSAKRFLATISFDSDTGLKPAMEKVTNYLHLIRDFPINDLLTSTSIEQLTQAVRTIFSHMKKIKNATLYPLARAFHLVEAFSRDLANQILKVLSAQRLMQQDYAGFEQSTGGCNELFRVWDDEVRQFKELVREQVKKRGTTERPPPKINCEHTHLQERIDDLRKFRKQHMKLKEVIEKVLTESKETEVQTAYTLFQNIDVLDVSHGGQQEWENVKKKYDEKIDHAESQITARLRDRLGAAKTATDMFRVFSKFSALFFRPRIKGAIQEYQSLLIQSVKEDIQRLQSKFKETYESTQACKVAVVRDIPPIAGKVIWARQLQRRLEVYMRRVEEVLGPSCGRDWEKNPEGQKLKQECDSFAKGLNTNDIWEKWLKDNNIKDNKSFDVGTKIFEIQSGADNMELVVNFDAHTTTLFKEVRHFQSLQCRVPYSVKVTSDEAKLNYPYATTLRESVRTYISTCSNITPRIAPIIAHHQNTVQQQICDGLALKWDSEPLRVESYIRKLSDQVFFFQDKVAELLELSERMDSSIDNLDGIDLHSETPPRTQLQNLFEKIQTQIDDMNLASYSNLEAWVKELNTTLEGKMAMLLQNIIAEWLNQFQKWPHNGATLITENTVHELQMHGQTLILEPPKEAVRMIWVQHFHDTLGMVVNLPRIQAGRFDNVMKRDQAPGEKTYKTLLKGIDEGTLLNVYNSIDVVVAEVEEYVKTWLRYQSLWDITTNMVVNRLDNDLQLWHQLLAEIGSSRASIDSAEPEKSFGPITVDFTKVQSKVNQKYDQWHREILSEFGRKVGDNLSQFYSKLNQARLNLEKQAIETTSGADMVPIVMVIQSSQRHSKEWGELLENLRSSQRLLDRQRYQFPSDWLVFDRLDGEWEAFKQILEKKAKVVERELPTLRQAMVVQDKLMDEKITQFYAEWSTEKPVGNILPSEAVSKLDNFNGKLEVLKEEHEGMMQAKLSMNLEVANAEVLVPLQEEMASLRGVWSELSHVHSKVDAQKEIPWAAVVIKKVKAALDEIQDHLKGLPPKLRQYDAFEAFEITIKTLLKVNALLADLKTDALMDRHWKAIIEALGIKVSYNQMTLGHLWDANLVKNEEPVRVVLNKAQGEMGLSEFLKQVSECWKEYVLDLVPYKSKCRLIRGWDDVFAQIDDHVNSLTSMKMSPYYKTFEDEAVTWEDKLNKIRVCFDLWMDVQRRWVYLEGIFLSGADIQALLPQEYNRFRTIDKEFTDIMKKTAAKPKVLDAVAIDGIQKSLDRISEMLKVIQKALGEYLEKQRSNFARFYFIGDEDLLEMIGNSRDVGTVSRHLIKMFAGLATLMGNPDDADQILGMQSKENETVTFSTPLKISDDPAINAWLGRVEQYMQNALGEALESSVNQMSEALGEGGKINEEVFLKWLENSPAQIVVIAMQVDWSTAADGALTEGGGTLLESVANRAMTMLYWMADTVLTGIDKRVRLKLEQLITELVHQRDVSRDLFNKKVANTRDFDWLQMMRFYWNPKEEKLLEKLSIRMADASFFYGFEYLGIAEKLVQTKLTDRCFLTLTQALNLKLGGNPFGPAGTGKTESVKALGAQLARFVLVFCCDDGFDFNAMGRIFIGLCQVGAWGCFDEFNRLEERILSACSEQILTINLGNKAGKKEIEICGKTCGLNSKVGIFITMNPGYAGRSNLPDNLKQLFRGMAMMLPDKKLIAEVMLFAQGFKSSERLAGKIVSLFELCKDQLSNQPHYDFGLRSLKAVLGSAGALKREAVARDPEKAAKMTVEENIASEQGILLRSLFDTLVPKLIAQDKPLLNSLMQGVFPGAVIGELALQELQEEIRNLCKLRHLDCTDIFMEKCMQLYQIQNITHGVMLVGPVGTGKSSVWHVLMDAMERCDKIKGDATVIDPKAVQKEELYGKLDGTTLEWTDGVFTDNLRRILANQRGEMSRRQWLVFDGDVDPEWAENLNSVLDDNKLLTLPNGERLGIPPCVRLIFEVETLKYATLATVSRCGMVWFSDDVVTPDLICSFELKRIKFGDLENKKDNDEKQTPQEQINVQCVDMIEKYFANGSVVMQALDLAMRMDHIMVMTAIRVITSLFSVMRKGLLMINEFNEAHEDFPLTAEVIEKFITKHLIFCICWAFGGDMTLKDREQFCRELSRMGGDITMPAGLDQEVTLLDFEVRVDDGEWHAWRERVPQVEIDESRVSRADVIIDTVDTTRHRAALAAWFEDRCPFILCGPPGSGKSMTLMATLKAKPEFDLASLNFSAGTGPDLIHTTLDMYCECVKTQNGFVFRPTQPGRELVVFCDECNLPQEDKYGTQRVVMLMRQCTEFNGFYRPTDREWITLERIQFLGACNPPTDPGRFPLSDRFLRHCPIMWVDYPGKESLIQIYGTFNRAMLRRYPQLAAMGDPLTRAQVQFWRDSSAHFTTDMQPHYLYSPRELTRWKIAIVEALKGQEGMTEGQMIRLFIHEGLRIFCDRLVNLDEREWTNKRINDIAMQEFGCDEATVQRPLLYSCYMNGLYAENDPVELRALVQGKLQVFYEEELAVKLVIFDEVLDHIIRMDRVLRQPLGHLLLVGASGAGKTVLSKFVSWMNGLSVYQLKIGKGYDVVAFECDLRYIMKRSGVKGEKITFIFDESNALGPAFIERMNALLACGEVPGLFEAEEFMNLINECRSAQIPGVDDAEIFAKFTKNVQRNLHIVFTMNPANPDFYNRGATSPALLNRCVIDWFGDWPHEALRQVSADFTKETEIGSESFSEGGPADEAEMHATLASTIVSIHETVDQTNLQLQRSAQKFNFITPRDYLSFITHFMGVFDEKRGEVLDQQKHLQVGLDKLKETEEQVGELQKGLAVKEVDLAEKNKMANDKMEQMVVGQGQAEEKKITTTKLSEDLAVQTQEIQTKKEAIQKEICEVEPALIEAQNAVKGIDKKSLDELRNLAKPPDAVKLAIEGTVILVKKVGKGDMPWDAVRKALKEATFIQNVVGFDASSVDTAVRTRVEKMVASPGWDVEKIARASKAAGPLAVWVGSTLKFAAIMNMMEPLRNEMASMEAAAEANQKKLTEAEELITALGNQIQQYKDEYAQLIAAVTSIKSEMESVAEKCTRSVKLLSDLSGEKIRWSASAEGFQQQVATLLGDSLISGAFLTYIGFFDQYYRGKLLNEWRDLLEEAHIKEKSDLNLIDFLCNPAERLKWTDNALPDDDLCIENAIIMKRFIRYPLVIDPSGQAITFLSNIYADRRLMKTSFGNPQFAKHLESALRFGTPLMVNDVEKVDPILNSVLNKETTKSGGRVLITVGDQDIDFSPSFIMFMSTRDSNAIFTPDLCSRVTFVNFTITPSSLQSQCLNMVLKSERPDVDKKRSDMLKLQGECKVKIRALEDGLLNALSNVQGSILEDLKVIKVLETLKTESAQIEAELAKVDGVMAEIETATQLYSAIGHAAARVFFTLESLGNVHFLYRFSLTFFFEVFHLTIKDESIQSLGEDYEKRLKVITTLFFKNALRKISPGLKDEDVTVYALRLAQIMADLDAPLGGQEMDFFLRGAGQDIMKSPHASVAEKCSGVLKDKLNSEQLRKLQDLMLLPQFHGVVDSMQSDEKSWVKFLEETECENLIPDAWRKPGDKANEFTQILQDTIIIKALRPDRLLPLATRLIEAVMGQGYLDLPAFDLKNVVEHESSNTGPVMMVSAPGFDPSAAVTDLSLEIGKVLKSAAMGSEEGFQVADQGILYASKAGAWVLLKNVHLAIDWLHVLEKKLYGMNSHDDFRLFLTLEFNPRIPPNLIRLSRVYVFEPPSGLKASLQRSFTNILVASKTDKPPVERCRLHFLLGFLHAVTLERVRFAPVGWTKKYEFNDSDQICARDVIDNWIDDISQGGELTNISPDKIPWDALVAIISQAMYGGRVDNEFDGVVLVSFVRHLFCLESFEASFALNKALSAEHKLVAPDARKHEQFVEWIEKLPVKGSPAWVGLPVHAEKLLRVARAEHTVTMFLLLQSAADDIKYETKDGEGQGAAQKKKGRRQTLSVSNWLTDMADKIKQLVENLPKPLSPMERTEANLQNPLWRCIDREVEVGRALLAKVKTDLEVLLDVCEGRAKTSNDTRAMATQLNADQVPPSWKKYPVADFLGAAEWLTDFARRLEQLRGLQATGNFSAGPFWLGGLFFPEAFLTASRQWEAAQQKVSLEELGMVVEIGGSGGADAFMVKNMSLEGACWDSSNKQLQLTDELTAEMPVTRLKWIQRSLDEYKTAETGLLVPVYLNTVRNLIVTSFMIQAPKDIGHDAFVQRGAAVCLWRRG